MFKFKCFFLDNAVSTVPQLESYADFFLHYQPSKWQIGSGDGVFSFVSNEGDRYDLFVLENPDLGISVRSNSRCRADTEGHEFYSVAFHEKIHQIVDAGDEQFAPAGSFLKPEVAWLAVEDFFNDPQQKSERIQWIASNDIVWPDNS